MQPSLGLFDPLLLAFLRRERLLLIIEAAEQPACDPSSRLSIELQGLCNDFFGGHEQMILPRGGYASGYAAFSSGAGLLDAFLRGSTFTTVFTTEGTSIGRSSRGS